MSITLNNSDFQCLQDQLVDLKTKNYELAEKNRRSQADFEAAKAKIYSLQLKLEEQERDFQITSTTLRREIEVAYATSSSSTVNNSQYNSTSESDDDKETDESDSRYNKQLSKSNYLQHRYDKSLGVIQQLKEQINSLTNAADELNATNKQLTKEFEKKQEQIVRLEQEYNDKLKNAIEELEKKECDECKEHIETIDAIKSERDTLEKKVEQLRQELRDSETKIESLSEELRIQDKRGSRLMKELKRQLTVEKNRNEILQKNFESLLNESTSRSTGGNPVQGDDISNGSWSLVAKDKNSTPSICSIESEDRETVQPQASSTYDTISQSSQQQSPSSKSMSRFELVSDPSSMGHHKNSSSTSPSQSMNEVRVGNNELHKLTESDYELKFEDQAALMDRVTRLQHDKWTLEEKLSYMEQANAALTQDLANKSQVVRQYFMDQAIRSVSNHSRPISNDSHYDNASVHNQGSDTSSSRRVSFPNNFNQLLVEKPSLKKMVDFLKERGQASSISGSESEKITREATKKMQIMLEETLVKCFKLQENLDFVTSELNKLRSG